MRAALTLLLALALIAPVLGHIMSSGPEPKFDVTLQPAPKVLQLSGASPDIFLQIRGGANLTPFAFTWGNRKFPKVNVTDENIQKEVYTDAAYSYLHNWSTIIPPIPKA